MKKRDVQGRHKAIHDALHWSNLPPGIKVLAAYTGIIALLYIVYLLFGVTKPVSIIFGLLVRGAAATFLELLGLAVLLSIIYGLLKRHYWVFYVSLAWFSFGLLNALISLLMFKSEFGVLRNVLFVSSFVVIVLNGIIVWYVYSEKQYFMTKHLNKKTKAKDRFFVYVVTVAIIVSLLFLITFGLNFYSSTMKTTNKVIDELQASSNPEQLCREKNTTEQDICYLVLSIMNEEKEPGICESINSDFYKITCYRALE